MDAGLPHLLVEERHGLPDPRGVAAAGEELSPVRRGHAAGVLRRPAVQRRAAPHYPPLWLSASQCRNRCQISLHSNVYK